MAAIKLQELIEQLHKMVKDDRLWIKVSEKSPLYFYSQLNSLKKQQYCGVQFVKNPALEVVNFFLSIIKQSAIQAVVVHFSVFF